MPVLKTANSLLDPSQVPLSEAILFFHGDQLEYSIKFCINKVLCVKMYC